MKIKIGIVALVLLLVVGCNKNGTTTQEPGSLDAKKSDHPVSKEKVLLRLNFPKGFEQEVTYKMHTDVKGNGYMDESNTFTFKAEPKTEGGKTIYVFSGKVDRIRWDSTVFGEKDSYDSAAKQNTGTDPDMLRDVNQILNHSFTFSADDRGTVLQKFDFEGISYSDLDQLVELNTYFISFPEEEVGVGSTWKGGYTNSLTNQQVTTEYTLKDITKDKVTIGVVSTIAALKGIMKENKLTGEYVLDRTTGMLLESQMEGGLKITMNATMTSNFYGKKL